MKNKIKIVLLIAGMFISHGLFSQIKMLKASNCKGLYNTNMPFTWSGSVKDGYCQGKGTIKWYRKGKYMGKMVGNLKKGKNHGYCTLYDATGVKTFEGIFVNDKRNGRGKVYYSNGTYELGKWVNDVLVETEEATVIVDTVSVASNELLNKALDKEDIEALQEILEEFCYSNYSDCFSGRKYVEYSLSIDHSETVEEGVYKVSGIHSYKGSYGIKYSGMSFTALIYTSKRKIVFNKKAKADYFHDSDYWEDCTKGY